VIDSPGITRDRNFELAEWNGRKFSLVDTGGYETVPRDATFEQMRLQSLTAVEEADVVILLTDVHEDGHPVDEDVADILRRSSKPVILAVNKCDNQKIEQEAMAFYSLGFEDLFAISCMNGSGVADMLDRVVDLMPEKKELPERGQRYGVRIAVMGRPNVGKSSLVNTILRRERVVVNSLPGTTRDTIDTTFRFKPDNPEAEERVYTLVDTAGLRKRGKIERGVEKISTMQAHDTLGRSHVALVLIDASEGLTEQDKHIAGFAHEDFRPSIVVVNKWDLVEKDSGTAGQFAKDLRDRMPFLAYAPIIMVSALTGLRVGRLLGMVDELHTNASREVRTSDLNVWLQAVIKKLSPPFHKGRQLRIKYVTQTGVRPPSFTFFVNDPNLIHFSYERFLTNQLREAFDFQNVPIRLRFKRKSRRDKIAHDE
jgi:GTPase